MMSADLDTNPRAPCESAALFHARIEAPCPRTALTSDPIPQPSANFDSGLCTPWFYGCMDNGAENYKSLYTKDDGSCTKGGCTDPTDASYDAAAACCRVSATPLSNLDVAPAERPKVRWSRAAALSASAEVG